MILKLLCRDRRPVRCLINTDTDQMLELILRLGDVSVFLFYFGQITEPKMTPRLTALVRWVVELCDAGL
jgi:hypothetical protein